MRTILNNAAVLAAGNGASMALSLVLLVLVARRGGLEVFAEVQIALSLLAIAGTLSEFGYNYSAPLRISGERSVETVRRDTSLIWYSRLILAVPSGMAAVTLFGVMPLSQIGTLPFALSALLYLGGSTLQPQWLYISKREFRHYTTSNVVAKVVIVLLLWRAGEWAKDGANLLALLASAGLIAATVSATRTYRLLGALPRWPGLIAVGTDIRRSYPFFFSSLAAAGYSQAVPPLLGVALGAREAGMLIAFERIRSAGSRIISTLSSAAFPDLVSAFKLSSASGMPTWRRLALAQLVLAGLFGMSLGLFACECLRLIDVDSCAVSEMYRLGLVFLPITACLIVILGHGLLMAGGDNRGYFVGVLGCLILLLLGIPVLGRSSGESGALLAIVLAEAGAVVIMAVRARHRMSS